MLEYEDKGYEPGIDGKIIKMAANASGIRDTARVLGVSIQKVVDTLKNIANDKPNQPQLPGAQRGI
jgi:transposase-like protein